MTKICLKGADMGGRKFVGKNNGVPEQPTLTYDTKNRFSAVNAVEPEIVEEPFVAPITEPENDYEYDLNKLSLKEVADKLQRNLNSGDPGTCIFVWSARRKVEKQELAVRHQQLLIEQIRALGIAAEEMAATQAKLYLMPDLIEDIKKQRLDQISIRDQEVLTQLDEHKTKRVSNEILVDRAREENRRQKIETDMYELRQRAEINLIGAQEKESLAKAEFVKHILEKMDITEFPGTLQTYIISSIFNPNGTQFNDFDMQEQIKKFVIQQEEAKAKKAASEADQERAQADIQLYDVRKQIESNK